MENKIKIVPAEIMMEHTQALLKEKSIVPLVVSGNSMSPFLVHGRDTVYLGNIERPLRCGDIVLYRRANGSYILHRICKVNEDSFDMVGDAQTVIEHAVKREDMIAVVCFVNRKGKLLKRKNICRVFFERIWIRIIPLRPFIVKLFTKLHGKR